MRWGEVAELRRKERERRPRGALTLVPYSKSSSRRTRLSRIWDASSLLRMSDAYVCHQPVTAQHADVLAVTRRLTVGDGISRWPGVNTMPRRPASRSQPRQGASELRFLPYHLQDNKFGVARTALVRLQIVPVAGVRQGFYSEARILDSHHGTRATWLTCPPRSGSKSSRVSRTRLRTHAQSTEGRER